MGKILLSSSKSIGAVNEEQCLKVNLSNRSKLLTKNSISEKLDLLEEYNLERDNCTSLRLTFNIYPYCSNILYNTITEIVKDEGTKDCFCQNMIDRKNNSENKSIKLYDNKNNFSSNPFNVVQAIRDTEYSHKELGNFVYHCGLDILNNHILRTNDFNYVNNISGNQLKNFNSIEDYIRDNKGNVNKKEMFYVVPGDNQDEVKKKIDTHIYTLDNISNLRETFRKQVFEKNGWFGFKNASFIDIPVKKIFDDSSEVVQKEYQLNKVLNNNKSCEMIDFYPDRSLYSFVPKYNKARRRAEANWDYFLTYPYENNFEKFNYLNENEENAIKVISSQIVTTNSGSIRLQFKTFINHNLKPGDYVKIYFKEKDVKELSEFPRSIKVSAIGDINNANYDKKHYFSISYNEIKDFIETDRSKNTPLKYMYFFRKTHNQVKCDYYFRMLKKIRLADGTIPTSGIGKLAYSETIFGDRVSELIYTDTIDTSNLKTNRGKKINELFLTIIKRNAGRTKWYRDEDTGNERVEYSHCFGKVTSGLDLSTDSTDYNIHRLHNVERRPINEKEWSEEYIKYATGINLYVSGLYGENAKPKNWNCVPEVLEDDITDKNEVFYGDIVEYDPYTDTETVIENVYHRFNTEQRELYDKETFYHFYFDEIYSDDFDVSQGSSKSVFQIEQKDFSKFSKDVFFPDNLMLEGYYYNPHFRIKVRPMDVIPHNEYGEYINADFSETNKKNEIGYFERNEQSGTFEFCPNGGENCFNAIKIHTPKRDSANIGDKCLLFKECNKNNIWGRVIETQSKDEDDNYILVSIKDQLVNNGKITELGESILSGKYNLIIVPENVPSYASFVPNGEMLFSWRDPGLYSTNNPVDNMNDATFSNGCIYLENSVRFFLRRQDPFGTFGLRSGESIPRELNNYIPEGEAYDISRTEYVPENNNLICG